MISNPLDVKACLTRVLALMEDRDKVNEDIAKVLEEYKPKGVVAKGIRRVAALQRMDKNKRQSDEQMFEDYEAAFDLATEAAAIVSAGGTYQDARDKTGLSRATVARAVKASREVSNEQENETVDHDPETGEIIEEITPSCSPAAATSAEQPSGNAAVVPTGNEGNAGEQDPFIIPPHLRRERVSA